MLVGPRVGKEDDRTGAKLQLAFQLLFDEVVPDRVDLDLRHVEVSAMLRATAEAKGAKRKKIELRQFILFSKSDQFTQR